MKTNYVIRKFPIVRFSSKKSIQINYYNSDNLKLENFGDNIIIDDSRKNYTNSNKNENPKQDITYRFSHKFYENLGNIK